MRAGRRNALHEKPSFAFVVDGHTEVWYLQMLKRHERRLNLKIKPEIPNRKSIEDQGALVMDLADREYSRVFWLVDLDVLLKESKKGLRTPWKRFSELRQRILRKKKNVSILSINPCLEFWFLLHFRQTSKQFLSCAPVGSELRSHLTDYEKSKRFFTREGDDIYSKLRPFLTQAIDHAERLGEFDPDDQFKAICEMHLLFQTDALRPIFMGV